MATVECKACGASVEIEDGAAGGKCPYCDSQVSLSQAVSGGLAPMELRNDEDEKFAATDGNIERLLDKLASEETEYLILTEPGDDGAFIQSCLGDNDGTYVIEYHTTEDKIGRLHETCCEDIDEVKDAFKKFRRGDFSFVDDYDDWEVNDYD